MKVTLPFNYTPREYQKPFYNALSQGYKRGVAVWHRRAGKDKTMLNLTIKEMFKRVGNYYYFFPTYKQGRKIMWDGIGKDGFPFMKHFPAEIIHKKNEQEMKITAKNGSMFQIIGTDRIDDNVGTNPVGCIYSEYSLQDQNAWNFMRPILRENGGWALFNFTPRGLNHGHEIYQTALRNDDWFCERRTVEDTGVLTPEDIQNERNEGMSESLIQQEYYCDFTVSSDDILIPLDLINMAYGKEMHISQYNYAAKIMGVDVGYGGDATQYITRQGLASWGLTEIREPDTKYIANRIAIDMNKAIEEKNPYDAVFIDHAYGFAVVERLKEFGFDNVRAVFFGSSAGKKLRFANKRCEMWYNIREWIESGGCIPKSELLKQDLSTPTYWQNQKDQIMIMPKDKMKKEIGRSPDSGDALGLTFAYPVQRKMEIKRSRSNYNVAESWEPNDYL